MRGSQLAQRLQRLFRPPLLNGSDNRIEDHHAENHPGVHVMLSDDGDDGGDDQQVNQRALDLFEHHLQPAFALVAGQRVRSVLLQPLVGLLRREAVGGRVHPLAYFVGRQCEPSRALVLFFLLVLLFAHSFTTFWGSPCANFRIFSTVVSRIRCTASRVLKALCGVTITLFRLSKTWSASRRDVSCLP